MMDLYTMLVEGIFQGPLLTLIVFAGAIFLYLMWCRVGIYTCIMVVELFALIFLWITGNLLFTGLILLYMLWQAFSESKKELAEP